MIAGFVDGVAERLVDEEYAQMIEDFPRVQTLRKIAHLKAKDAFLETDKDLPFPHRQPQRGHANPKERATSAAHVPGVFEDQEKFFGASQES